MDYSPAFLFFALIGAASLQAQSIEGKVLLPPARSAEVINKRYEMNVDASLIEPDPPLAVVYLEGKFPSPTGPATVSIPQKNLQFSRSLLPVLVGTKIEFPNEDDTYHNIFSFSKPKRFDLGRYRKDETPVPSQTFDQPGVVVLHCDIHEHMRAIVLVLETPHFALTDTAGNYQLKNLPSGHYQLKAWLNNKNIIIREVDLKPGVHLKIDFP